VWMIDRPIIWVTDVALMVVDRGKLSVICTLK
jgi:hypothetical protein